MKVLVACEFSGIVRTAFENKGHEAWSIDLIESDKPGYHIVGDLRNCWQHGKWDLMIAHPPCKYICNGGNNWLNRRPDLRWKENREKAVKFCRWILGLPIEKICLENPIGVLSTQIRKPDQIIHPYMFGHDVRKDTCLWLKNLPPLFHSMWVTGKRRKVDFWSSERNPNGRSLKSITYQGIADAMANQWG